MRQAIARRLAEEGAQVAFTYQGERIEKSVRELAESVSSPLVVECDVRSDDDVARVFGEVGDAAKVAIHIAGLENNVFPFV